jgi:selenoprotein W-related protein
LIRDMSIEYCGTCNYRPMAASLAMAVKQETGVQAELIHSNDMGAFEVKVDGRLIFSKKQSGRFPENAEVLAAIKASENE